ncbi:unnamed protein product [Blepharisma stoltei]|uniref:Uncharacterized protein n=1 Tax=Blepharisma stoltei TaxID=1481888 RepID=A0AAU9J2L9_9CILI|nr:unnamed protein product [Blepharisma stoltei]
MSSYDISLESFTPNDVKAMHSLLNVTEELLFAFPLPSELVKKYETMKEKVFSKINLASDKGKLWKMQREAYAKQKSTRRDIGIQSAEPTQELEKIRELKWKELEENANVIRWELLARLEASHYINKSYQNLTNLSVSSLSHIITRIGSILGIQLNQNTFVAQIPDEIPHEEPPEVNWNLPELEAQNAISLAKFKDLEKKETDRIEEFRYDFQQRESQILSFLDQIENAFVGKEEVMDSLQKELEFCHKENQSLNEKVQKEQQGWEEKIKNTQELLSTDKASLEFKLKKEFEEMKARHEMEIESIKKTNLIQIERLEMEKGSYENQLKRLTDEKIKIEEGSSEAYQFLKDDLKKQKEENKRINEQVKEIAGEKEELQAKIVKLEKQLLSSKEKIHKLEEELDHWEKRIENMKVQWKNEADQIKASYEREIVELSNSTKSETSTMRASHDQELRTAKQELSILHTQFEEAQYNYQKEIKSLDKALKTEKEIRLKLEEKIHEHEEALPEYQKIQFNRDQLQEAHLEAEKMLQFIKEKTGQIYEKHIHTQRDWNEQERIQVLLDEGLENYTEIALYVEFLIYYLLKSINDNNWLVDRIAELGQEIDKLRYLKGSPVKVVMTPSPAPSGRNEALQKKIWRDMRGTARALQEFEKSREKLIQHFQESV